MTTIYKYWPNDKWQDKTEIHDWCVERFGRGNTEIGWWSVTSHYNERPVTYNGMSMSELLQSGSLHQHPLEVSKPCPFLFSTNDVTKLTLFSLKWA
jgi:hypothetical protein